jgi:hypothetical protein
MLSGEGIVKIEYPLRICQPTEEELRVGANACCRPPQGSRHDSLQLPAINCTASSAPFVQLRFPLGFVQFLFGFVQFLHGCVAPSQEIESRV